MTISSPKLPLLLILGIFLTATLQADQPRPLEEGDIISVALTPESPAVREVPSSFIGFGLFYSNLPSFIGRNFERANPQFAPLMQRLARHQGPVPLRFGGGSVSETWYNPGGLTTPAGIDNEITPVLLDTVELLLDATGSQALFGLNASVTFPTLFEDMANGILDNIDEEKILSFELGNEPNRYTANGRRPADYDFDEMIVESDGFLTRFETLVDTTRPIVGPTLTLFRDSLEADPNWTLRLPEYIDEFSTRVGAISQNRYPTSDCTTNPNSIRFSSIENLLEDASSIGQAKLFTDFISEANDAGLPFWVHEHNTASCGGTDGSSNTFASALWFLDASFAWLAEGVEAVYVPFIRSGFYAPFLPSENFNGFNSNWTSEVLPMFYGMEMFAQTAGTDRTLVENEQISNSNVRAWVTRDENGFLYALLVNKSLEDSGNAKILLPGAAGDATAIRLLSPSAAATSGITFGGLTWDGSTNAIPNGTPTSEAVTPDADGLYELNLPAASAVLVTLPPLNVSDLVLARPVVSSVALTGQTLLLNAETSFGQGLSYQWEQISGPTLDITSPLEQLAAATFPQTGTYTLRLTVSDGNGNTDSETVTVSIVTPPVTSVLREVDGAFAFEAESFLSQTSGTGNFANHEWVQDAHPEASGGQFMRVTPSTGQRDRDGTEAPAIEFPLLFDTPGVWSVQVRMWGPDSDSDSLHIGFDSPTTSPNGIRQEDAEWIWTGEIPNVGQATVVVTEPGEQTLRVWPREDGVWLDRISLTLDASQDPASIPDSPLIAVGESAEISADISLFPSLLNFTSVADQNYLIEGSATLQPGDWVIEGITEATGPLETFPLPNEVSIETTRFFRVKELTE